MDPLPNGLNGRDALGRFAPGNTAGNRHARPFAKQAALLRKAFFAAVTEADMRALVRTLMKKATAGDLQAARLVLLWIVGKPHDAVWPDAIQAAVEAAEGDAEAQAGPLPMPGDREARERQAVRLLAQEMRRERQVPDPGNVVEEALHRPV